MCELNAVWAFNSRGGQVSGGRPPRSGWPAPARVAAHPGPGWPRTPGRTSERVRGERVLRLEVLVDALGAALAAQARHLPAAERRCGVGDLADVQPQHPA